MVSTGSTPVLFFIFSYPGCGHTVRMSQRRAILWRITRVPRAPLTSGRRRGHNTTFLSYEKSQSAYQIFSRSLYTFSAPSFHAKPWNITLFSKCASSAPRVLGVSWSPMIMLEGRPPSKFLLRLSSALPQANATICAATFAHSFCWLVLP